MLSVTSKHPIILASTSAIRKKILEDAGINFKAIPPSFDEEVAKQESPQKTSKQLAMFLAKGKALSISKSHPDAYVIGSDQVCEFEEKEFSKALSAEDATQQLKKFNGKVHFQNNATVIAFNGKIIFKNFSRVKMVMRKMPESEIENYVQIDQPIGCAGSYKYESLGKHLFQKINGDYFAVLGLAIQPLLSFLHQHNIITFN